MSERTTGQQISKACKDYYSCDKLCSSASPFRPWRAIQPPKISRTSWGQLRVTHRVQCSCRQDKPVRSAYCALCWRMQARISQHVRTEPPAPHWHRHRLPLEGLTRRDRSHRRIFRDPLLKVVFALLSRFSPLEQFAGAEPLRLLRSSHLALGRTWL